MKLDPQVFLDASYALAAARDDLFCSHKYEGLCSALKSYTKDTTLLFEYFAPPDDIIGYRYWWSPENFNEVAQEERFIALCLLYEIAKDMQK